MLDIKICWSNVLLHILTIGLLYIPTTHGTDAIYSCPMGWVHSESNSTRCYKVIDNKDAYKWPEAEQACEQLYPPGAYLVVPSSIDEINLLKALFRPEGDSETLEKDEIWIGCSDIAGNTTVRCYHEDGYTPWKDGRLPDKDQDKLNGVQLDLEAGRLYCEARKDGDKRPTICERPAIKDGNVIRSKMYVRKRNATSGEVLQDQCPSSAARLGLEYTKSAVRCGALCDRHDNCTSFNFIGQATGQGRPGGQGGGGKCELFGVHDNTLIATEGCRHYVEED